MSTRSASRAALASRRSASRFGVAAVEGGVLAGFSSFFGRLASRFGVAAVAGDVLTDFAFASASRGALGTAFASASRVALGRAFASASSVALRRAFASASRVALRRAFASASRVALRRAFASASRVALGTAFASASRVALGTAFASALFVASGIGENGNAAFAQSSPFASEAGVLGKGGERRTGTAATANGNAAANASRRFDPLRRDALGVQTRYPAVAKIVGRDAPQKREDGSQTIPLYYGTGTFVAEAGEWGIVVSCWHVVNEARDSIVVKFPTFSSPARVILRDETWDLAALLVRKPPRVAPIPISQEVPGVGDALWVAGYGESAGLAEFQIQGGRVQNYALLVTENEERAGGSNGANGSSGSNGSNGANGSSGSNGSSGGLAANEESQKGGRTEALGAIAPNGRGARRSGVGPSSASSVSSSTTPPTDSALLYETLAVDKGVRQGDSGGPIFNRYGELAGVLWGSNGESTMGTYCIRVQYFLTQAINRLAALEAERRLDASADDLLSWRPEDGAADAKGTELWARTALEASGVYPIAQRPAYVAVDGRETPENLRRVGVEAAIKRVKTALTIAENATATALPPSPPVFSPTFVSQQGLLRRVRPEVAELDFWTKLVDSKYVALAARRTSETAQVRETSVVDDESDATANVASAFAAESETSDEAADFPPTEGQKGLAFLENGNLDALKSLRPAKSPSGEGGEKSIALWKPTGLEGGEAGASGTGAARGASADWENDDEANVAEKKEERENKVNNAKEEKEGKEEDAGESADLTEGEEKTEGKSGGESAVGADGEDGEKEKKAGKRVNFNGVYLNDIQVYLIICAIFCLFYNAARLMTDADLKKERQKRLKKERMRTLEDRGE